MLKTNGWKRALVVTAILWLNSAALVRGQSSDASISGVVTDSTGAVLPGVRVTATHTATAREASATSNGKGFYIIQALTPGIYTVEAELQSFSKFQQKDLPLATASRAALDICLTLGVAETVNVSVSVPLLDARASTIGVLIESKSVEDLPLGDRRAMNVVQSTGASVFVGNYGAGGKPNFSLAGGRTQSQMFWIDGGAGQNMRLGVGQVDIDPPTETLREIKILSNNYSAEYGGSAGGVVIANTKSGTNSFHGSLFENFRHDALDAPGFFAPVVDGKKVRPPLRYNLYGATLGGPIRKDKTFFFLAYEGGRRKLGTTTTLTVPTDLQRTGDFSQTNDANGVLIPIFDPTVTPRTPFKGNVIPQARLDPVALKMMEFYPRANQEPSNKAGANNFKGINEANLIRHNITVKIDHHFSAVDLLNVRYNYNQDDVENVGPLFDLVGSPQASIAHAQFLNTGYKRGIGKGGLFEISYTFGNRVFNRKAAGIDDRFASDLGLQGIPAIGFPRFRVQGVADLGDTPNNRLQSPIRQHHLVSTFSATKGNHVLKVGGEVRGSRNVELNNTSLQGDFGFSRIQTASAPNNTTTGFGFASLLLGRPDSVSVQSAQELDRSSNYLAGFIQDDWTVGRSLTLNMGLRWEVDTPIIDANNSMNGFDPVAINPVSNTPGVVKFAGVNGWPEAPYDTDWNNFGPRLGFAWRPSEKTVVRGGFGIMYAHPFDHGAPTSASLGFDTSLSLNSPDGGITPPFLLKDGVPAIPNTSAAHDDSFGAVAPGRPVTTAVQYFDRNRPSGYAQQYNLGVQRQVGNTIIVEATYLGNLSRKLPNASLNINQIPADKVTALPVQANRPFPQFNGVISLFPAIGKSNYHAGLVSLTKRFSHGTQFNLNYTLAQFNSDADGGPSEEGSVGVYGDLYNRARDYGPAGNDIRHAFKMSGVYELPVGRGKKFLSTGILGRVVGNWTLGTLMVVQSGAPVTVGTITQNTNAFPAGGQRADLIGDPNLADKTPAKWFETAAFAQPAPGTFGNSPRGLVRGDGLFFVDLSLSKNISLGDEKRLQLRLESFNATNHTNFSNPNANFGAANFGSVSSARPARVLQLSARLQF